MVWKILYLFMTYLKETGKEEGAYPFLNMDLPHSTYWGRVVQSICISVLKGLIKPFVSRGPRHMLDL